MLKWVVILLTLLRLVDVGAGKKFQCKPRRRIAPTLTRTRAAGSGFWLTKLDRPLSPTDYWHFWGSFEFSFDILC